ncbi:MAG: ZIP family metal transporter [Acidobacteria bacterium]|nr:ZIP family metal transporter [Acidobacteriota bacterium]
MNIPWIGLALGLVAAAANFLGGLAVVSHPWHPLFLRYFVALSSGFMLAASLLEMLPESYRLLGTQSTVWVLVGYLLVHFFEHTVSAHFHFGEEVHTEEVAGAGRSRTVVFGLMIHTFVDGVSIASGFLISEWLGWVVFLAVFLHKMPEGFAVSSMMRASGYTTTISLAASGLLGLATLLGVLVMAPLHGHVAYTLPLSAGVTLYVAASDLIPVVNQEPGIRMAAVVFVGVLLLFTLKWLVGV